MSYIDESNIHHGGFSVSWISFFEATLTVPSADGFPQ